jgi:superfamily II DNA or RNA helicase
MNIKQNSMEECKEIIRKTEFYYRSGEHDIGKDFIDPSFSCCSVYKRSGSYFTSNALRSWASKLPHILNDRDIEIQLIITPQLSKKDFEALKIVKEIMEQKEKLQMICDNLILNAIEFSKDPDNEKHQIDLFIALVASEKLIIKFAIPEHVSSPGIYHEKIGIFEFPWKDKIVFIGSVNETKGGHTDNFESVSVYRDWKDSDKERVNKFSGWFDEMWSPIKDTEGLTILDLSEKALKKVKVISKRKKPNQSLDKWRHQQKALEKFLDIRHGILEMATGTGKTRTSLKIATELIKKDEISSLIICTSGNDLLDQWYLEILEWNAKDKIKYSILREYSKFHDRDSFSRNPQNKVLIVSRENLKSVLRKITPETRKQIFIIHDEVHGLGSPENINQLIGEHSSFEYRLGLSATSERVYDKDGTKFITDEIGEIFFEFEIEDAIKRGVICEFDYIPLSYNLTEGDKLRRKNIFARIEAAKKAGNPMLQKDINMLLSQIYKLAEQKPSIFEDFIRRNPEKLKNTIIFVETEEFGKKIQDKLHQVTHLYKTYYAKDDKKYLEDFVAGKIECLITCHKVSEGIDIKKLENVILFSSASSRLETVQRIGRCLRTNPEMPEKKATVVDFIVQQEPDSKDTADRIRYNWLAKLSQTKLEEKS